MDAAGDFEAYLKKFFKDDEDDAAAAVAVLLQEQGDDAKPDAESEAEPMNEWNLDKELRRFAVDLQAKHQKELKLVEEMMKNPDHEARAALFG